MGYSTFFDGAIKVVPRPDDQLIINMNVWLGMRHHMGLAQPQYKALLTQRAWEPDGPMIPDPDMALAKIREGSRVTNKDSIPNALMSTEMFYEPLPEHGTYCRDYNYPEIPGASLWSDVRVYPGDDCAYIAWDESEKAYEMDKWFAILVDVFSKMGFTCEGVVRAQGEDYDDRWSVVAKDGEVQVIASHDVEPTWHEELATIREKFKW